MKKRGRVEEIFILFKSIFFDTFSLPLSRVSKAQEKLLQTWTWTHAADDYVEKLKHPNFTRLKRTTNKTSPKLKMAGKVENFSKWKSTNICLHASFVSRCSLCDVPVDMKVTTSGSISSNDLSSCIVTLSNCSLIRRQRDFTMLKLIYTKMRKYLHLEFVFNFGECPQDVSFPSRVYCCNTTPSQPTREDFCLN